jgi:hypothetical protein
VGTSLTQVTTACEFDQHIEQRTHRQEIPCELIAQHLAASRLAASSLGSIAASGG